MVPSSVISETIPPTPTDAVTRFLDSLSSLDADQVLEQFAYDARVSTRGGLYAAGKTRIRKMLKRCISSILSFHCQPAAVWSRDGVSVIEVDVTCERLDGALAIFPVTLILRFHDRLISEVRFFTYEPASVGNFLRA